MIEEKDLTASGMIGKMLTLSNDDACRKTLDDNALSFGKVNACEDIYEYMLEIINK